MESFPVILLASLKIFGVIGIGAFCRKRGWLDPCADAGLTRLIINVLFPCLVLDKLLGNPALLDASNLLLAPLVGFGTVAAGFALCRVCAPLLGLHEPVEAGSFSFTAGMYNYGFIPIPLCIALFDAKTLGTLFVHNVGVEVALWSIGVVMLTGGRFSLGSLRKLINMPLITVGLSVLLTLGGQADRVPGLVTEVAAMVGACSIPFALFMTGALVYDVIDGSLFKGHVRVGLGAIGLRQLLLPVLMLLLMMTAPLNTELKRVIMLQAAMPSAVFPIVLARHYSGSIPTTVRVVVATFAVGLVSIPLRVAFGLKLLK